MATPDKSLFKEKTQREKDQEMISGIGAKAAMDAGISKNARARLDTSSPAIKDAIKRRNLAQKQLDERKAKKDAKKNTVNYSDATKPKKTTPKKKPAKKGLFGEGDAKTRNGKANVSRKQLSDFGGTLTQYMNQWNKSGKRPTKVSKAKTGSDDSKPKKKGFRPFGGAVRRALLGKDEKFGGDKGAIDFIRRKKKPKNKAGGGMMKSKMASKGGMMKAKGMAKGGKMAKKGYASGGVAKKPVPPENKGLKKLPKDVRNKMGYMKGGGMAKKGYSKGGAVKKKSKPRGVGVALRGYGKAMR